MRRLILTVALFACFFVTSCSDSEVRSAAKAANGIANGLSVVQDQVEFWHDTVHAISDDEARAASLAVKDATVANDAFVDCVRAAKSQGSGVACFDALEANLEKNSAQILHVKNPDAQAALKLAFHSVDVAVGIIRSFLHLPQKSLVTS